MRYDVYIYIYIYVIRRLKVKYLFSVSSSAAVVDVNQLFKFSGAHKTLIKLLQVYFFRALSCFFLRKQNRLTRTELYIHVTVHRNKFIFNKTYQTRKFPKFFILSKTLHVSGISFAHHQEFSTVHSALLYFLQF